jgi:hypothetical protein
MLNLDPVTLILARRKGISTRDALLFSAVIPAAGTTSLGTVGQVILANKITDRIVVRRDVPVQPLRLNIAPVPGLSVRPIAPSFPFLFPITKPVLGTPTALSLPRFIQKIQLATLVDLTTDPPRIEGAAGAGLKIDFASPIDAATYNWDFGDPNIKSSPAKNPTTKTYNNAGDFDVTLTTTDAGGTETETAVAKVKVN